MIRGITISSAALLGVLIASPVAFAGSYADVVQAGDNQYSIVIQNRNKTMVKSGVGTHMEKKIGALAQQASRQVAPSTGRMGGARCNSYLGGANAGYVAQAGVGNIASTSQFGQANIAGTQQSGNGNASYIVQRGTGHEAYATQEGNNNTSLIIQRC
ncbi:MAG: hypothetical protein KF895_15315 [Parvibaculum sp.]|nr:hypothetical protein [Parvibaculum sp.]